ncbi:hypothetical protein HYPSUDRAFT_44930 [Hypholoma sublateritium FD-334 SS-4]|uniref:Ig-like domain-containing protein n=1 Tax=Hypholoma sublateritium (strain FD-334 SS-4) TaxID=945553 RepID=A0A0D2M6H7_HYPSF|nr:hypothetical protein HYPSUDRAFT_44930 [Hypholoma sublateritium FD-334 SS-4]
MQLTNSFLSLLAAAQAIVAVPFGSSHVTNTLAPVPVTKLVCDGNSFKCTASLDFGDGNWVAQWGTAVFHTGLFGAPDHKEFMHEMTLAPVPVTKLVCDGDTFQCTANLDFGDGRWVAQWSTSVFHNSLRSETTHLAPVPVTKLVCDGDSFKCTGSLDFGDGKWVAQWSTSVFHQSAFFLEQK